MKKSPVEYWIWLQTALGAGARTDEILAYFESPQELYNAGYCEWRLSGLFTSRKLELLQATKLSQSKEVIAECNRKGYGIITPDSNLFPERLRSLVDMPLVLYAVGDTSVLNLPVSIGIVGTRNASAYGIETAQKLSYQLASCGAVVVSGGALGIDSEAHAGAMLAKGQTIAYLGCGLSVNYLKENASLRRAIARHGAVVSEYQPFTSANRTTFPIRNRLISGTALGVVVIEAGVKSGSLITANRALEQGRDVFAVPGDIVRSSFDGTNHLIKHGAKPVFSADDVLCEYEYLYGEYISFENAEKKLSEIPYTDYRNKTATTSQVEKREREESESRNVEKKELPADISEASMLIYSVMSGEPIHIDDIVRQTNLKMNAVLSSLTELELLGFVEAESGKNYKLK